MVECLERMIVEIVDSKKLVKIKDLNSLTIGYDVYDITNTLRLNDKSSKALMQKELNKEIQELDNWITLIIKLSHASLLIKSPYL